MSKSSVHDRHCIFAFTNQMSNLVSCVGLSYYVCIMYRSIDVRRQECSKHDINKSNIQLAQLHVEDLTCVTHD